jgi:hypothetical protein
VSTTAEAPATVWISTTEAAARAGVALRTMQYYAADGKVRTKRSLLNGRLYIDAGHLDQLLAGQVREPAASQR